MDGAMSQYMTAIFLSPSITIMEACVKMKTQSALAPSDYHEQEPLYWTTRKMYETNFSWCKIQSFGDCHCDKTCYILTEAHVQLN